MLSGYSGKDGSGKATEREVSKGIAWGTEMSTDKAGEDRRD